MLDGSGGLRLGFTVLTLLLGLGAIAAVRWVGWRRGPEEARRWTIRAVVAVVGWIGLTAALAAAGALRFEPFPPTIVLLLLLSLGVVIAVVRSEAGRRLAEELPLAVLVGYQSFRVVVELLLHRSWTEGLMPVQMSFEGYNFDIVSGLSAAVIGLWLWRAGPRVPRWVVPIWNAGSLALVLNVVTIAILSSPLPIRRFHNEPSNLWITAWPWVWLPTVMVVMALIGHGLVFRRLAARLRTPVLSLPS